MTADRWNRIESLFHKARELNPEERPRFLESECGADSTTRRTLDKLLRADRSTHVLLDGVVTDSLATTLTPGMSVGPYEVVGIAGIGGMGQVFRAMDHRLRREVAIKALPLESTTDKERLARLHHEATLLASVNHENIAAIYDVIERQDEPTCLILEFVPGTTLAEKLDTGPFPLNEAVEIARQISLALEAAHASGVVHRDLKPGNIKLTPSGKVKVLDFGLARVLNAPDEQSLESPSLNGSKLTTSGPAGTPAYMSPEQVRGTTVDRRTDIWAFGCVVYELLTGWKAFPKRTHGAIESSDGTAEPDWALLPLDTTSELQNVLRRCLDVDVNRRFNDASELRRTIEEVQKTLGQTSVLVTSRLRPRRRVVVGVLAVCAILGAVAISGFPWLNQLRVGESRQLTFGPVLELDPAISPDGQQVAYASQDGLRTDIYVRPLAGGAATNVTRDMSTTDHRWPRWAPDGVLAFMAAPIEPGSSNADSIEHTIFVTTFPYRTTRPVTKVSNRGFDWSPDGKELVIVRDREILAIAPDGNRIRRVAGAPEPQTPTWSPDAKWIAFVSGNLGALFRMNLIGNHAPSSIWVVSSGGGEPIRLTDSGTTNTSPVWLKDSKSLLFISNRNGDREIFKLELPDAGSPPGIPKRIGAGLHALTIDISKDRAQLVYAEFLNRSNLWSLPIPKSGRANLDEAKALTTGEQIIEGVGVSEDSNWIAFDSNRSGNQDIYKMPRWGGEPIRLTDDPKDEFSPTWSPDNKSIAFHSFRTGNRDIYVMNADGSGRHQITSDPAHERYPDWSPDGQSLTFLSDKTGRQQVHVISKRNDSWGEPRQITWSKEHALFPRYSPDGRTIAYIDSASGLSVMSPDGESARTLVPLQLIDAKIPSWGNDSRTIYFKAGARQGSIWSVPASGGSPTLLVQFDDAHNFARVEFDTDGKDLFFTMAERKSDIWLLKLR